MLRIDPGTPYQRAPRLGLGLGLDSTSTSTSASTRPRRCRPTLTYGDAAVNQDVGVMKLTCWPGEPGTWSRGHRNAQRSDAGWVRREMNLSSRGFPGAEPPGVNCTAGLWIAGGSWRWHRQPSRYGGRQTSDEHRPRRQRACTRSPERRVPVRPPIAHRPDLVRARPLFAICDRDAKNAHEHDPGWIVLVVRSFEMAGAACRPATSGERGC
jgi:hypothetical protein